MSRYSTNPEWLKVQSEKLSSDAQKQISIFKKYSTPQNQLSKNDLKVLGKLIEIKSLVIISAHVHIS